MTTLCADLRLLAEERDLRPDFLFFTGDAAYGQLEGAKGDSIRDQFRLADEFLTAIRNVYQPPLERRDVCLVPGNHDVNRTDIDESQIEWLSSDRRTLDDIAMMSTANRQFRRYLERLHDYRNFLQEGGYDHLLTDELGRHFYADCREIAGNRIGIAGFNSAWSCNGGRQEKGSLWMGGHYQVEEALANMAGVDFRIALIHHPANWFVEQEDPAVQRLLEGEFQFLLHGHEHQGWVRCDAATGHAQISGAACYDRSDRLNGYIIVRLVPSKRRGEVWLRQYDSAGGGWIARNVSGHTRGGRWTLKHMTPWLRKQRRTRRTRNVKADVAGSESTKELSIVGGYERRFCEAMLRKHDYLELFGADIPRESQRHPLSVAYVSLNLSDDEDIQEVLEQIRLLEERKQKRQAKEEELQDELRDTKRTADMLVTEKTAALKRKLNQKAVTLTTKLETQQRKHREEDERDGTQLRRLTRRLDFVGTLPVEELLNRLTPESSRILIRGVAGSGKSTLFRWATIQAARC